MLCGINAGIEALILLGTANLFHEFSILFRPGRVACSLQRGFPEIHSNILAGRVATRNWCWSNSILAGNQL